MCEQVTSLTAARVVIGVLPDERTATELVRELGKNGAQRTDTLLITGKPSNAVQPQMTSVEFSVLAELEQMKLWRTCPPSSQSEGSSGGDQGLDENIELLFYVARSKPELFSNFYQKYMEDGCVLVMQRVMTPEQDCSVCATLVLAHSSVDFQMLDILCRADKN